MIVDNRGGHMTDRGAKTMVRAVRVQIPETLEEIKRVRVDSGELFNENPPPANTVYT